MVETPQETEKVFEKESPFIYAVKSEEEIKKKYALTPTGSKEMVVTSKPVRSSAQMSTFKPA